MCDFSQNGEPPVGRTPYQYLNETIIQDVYSKFLSYYQDFKKLLKEGDYFIEIYTSLGARSYIIWRSMFPLSFIYWTRTDFPLIPLPDNYEPSQYDEYVNELRDYVEHVLAGPRGAFGSVYNLGTKEAPQMNLFLASRKLKEAELHSEEQLHTLEVVAVNDAANGSSSDAEASPESHLEEDASLRGVKQLLRAEILSTMVDTSDGSPKGESVTTKYWRSPLKLSLAERTNAIFEDGSSAHYEYLNASVIKNVNNKFFFFYDSCRLLSEKCGLFNENQDLVVVFTNKEIQSERIWWNMFHYGNLNYFVIKNHPLVPLPDNYQPSQYDLYVNELRDCVRHRSNLESVVGGVFDLGTKEAPQMNLFIATRKLKKAELRFEVRKRTTPEREAESSESEDSEVNREVRKILGSGNPAEQLQMEILSTIVDLSDSPIQDEPASGSDVKTPSSGINPSGADKESDELNRKIAFVGPQAEGLALGDGTTGSGSNDGEEFRTGLKTLFTGKNSSSVNGKSDEPSRKVARLEPGAVRQVLGEGSSGSKSNDDE